MRSPGAAPRDIEALYQAKTINIRERTVADITLNSG
jgi:hypothetical protein